MRTKLNVEYPLAKTINEAIHWIKQGGEVWQEISDDFPECGGFDDIDCLKENFPEEDFDYHENIQDHYLHLCPADEEYAKPFKVGERVWATEELDVDGIVEISSGDSFKIKEIHAAGTLLRLDDHSDIWWSVDKFCRCVLPVRMEKAYICYDPEATPMGITNNGVYKDLNFLKQECEESSDLELIWSDEYDDFEEFLDELGILNNYSGSNWDIEAIDKKTGYLCYGVAEDNLRIQYV